MTTEQKTYAMAKAHFETIKAIVDKEKAKLPDITLDNNTAEAWELRSDIEYKHGYWEARDVLLKAEQALVTATQTMLKTKRPADYTRVKDAFEKEIWNEELKQKRIELCFLLDARTV